MIPKKIEDIPKTVKSLPSLGQHMWLRVYNRSIKTQGHSSAVETSWSIIRQFYKKTKKGKWARLK